MQRSIEQRSMKTMNNSEIFPVKEVLACLTHSPQVKYLGTHFFLTFTFIPHSPAGFARTHYRILRSLPISTVPLQGHQWSPPHPSCSWRIWTLLLCLHRVPDMLQCFTLPKINPNYRTIYSLITFFCLSILPIHGESQGWSRSTQERLNTPRIHYWASYYRPIYSKYDKFKARWFILQWNPIMEFRQAVILVFITLGGQSLIIGVFLSKLMYGGIYNGHTAFGPGFLLMFFFWIIAVLIYITGPPGRPWKWGEKILHPIQ